MADVATLAYLAGIIDGEGSVGFSRGNRVYFYLQVAMTERSILELLAETLGGRVHPRKGIGRLGTKSQWVWQLRGSPAWDAYYRIEPYLRLKRWKHEPK